MLGTARRSSLPSQTSWPGRSLTGRLKTHHRLPHPTCSKLVPKDPLCRSYGTYKVAAKGSFHLPNLVAVQKKVRKATAGGPKRVFGRVVEVAPKPETKIVKARVLKGLRDKVLG